MATTNENDDQEVKQDEEIVDDEDTNDSDDTDSSPDQNEDDQDTEDDESDVDDQTPPPVTKKVEVVQDPNDDFAVIPGETPRERALRIEATKWKRIANGNRGKEISEPARATAPEPKPESEVLKKYKPEEIQSLREVLPELAKELGYVRQEDLSASSYQAESQAQIDAFIAKHPEYSVEQDPDSTLWNRLKEEYQTVYKQPANPKDFGKIFERIHKDLFGIQARGPLPKLNAQQEKVKVASHAGASGPSAPKGVAKRTTTGLRFDALKGFSDADMADIQARADE